MELSMVAVIILLLLIVILLTILILAIDSSRKLTFGIAGLFLSGLFVFYVLACCVFVIYFGWNVLEHSLTNQVFWWVELFIAVCGLTVGVNLLITAISLFEGLWIILIRPEKKIEKHGLVFGCLSIIIIFLSTFLTSSGILVYQFLNYFRDGSWRSISVIDSVTFSFKDFNLGTSAGPSRLYFLGEFIPLWVGVIFIGVLFFLIFVTAVQFQHWIIDQHNSKKIQRK
jgi:hypothetical protein